MEENSKTLAPELAQNYHPMPYLHEIGDAFASADLVISRAGAATLGEYPLFWAARHSRPPTLMPGATSGSMPSICYNAKPP